MNTTYTYSYKMDNGTPTMSLADVIGLCVFHGYTNAAQTFTGIRESIIQKEKGSKPQNEKGATPAEPLIKISNVKGLVK